MESGREVKTKMNRKILGIAVCILTVAMLASPVMAIGPQNAVDNPNVDFPGGYQMLFLPNGQVTEFMPKGDIFVFAQHKPADRFQIRSAIEVTITGPQDLGLFFANENKWMYFTQTSYANFLTAVGVNPIVAAPYTEGIYVRFVNIGN